LPSEIVFPDFKPKRSAKAQLLGAQQKLKWTQKEEGMAIQLPKELDVKLLGTEAFVIKIK
jgi:alpha-L-fucosidase